MNTKIDWQTHLSEEVENRKEVIKKFWYNPNGIGRPLLSIRFEDFLPDMSAQKLMQDDRLDFQYQLKLNNDVLRYRSDFVPRLLPYMGSTCIASAFGAKIVFPDNNQPTCLPVINKPEDAFKIIKPDVYAKDLGRVFEKTEYFLEMTKGQYPITITDFQSPFDTVHLLWNRDTFFTDLVLYPESIEYLLNVVTDLTIELGIKLKEMIPNFVPAHCPSFWMPSDAAVTISLDSIVNIGPNMFDRFVRPSLERISHAFGGVVVHSCGNWKHHLQKVKTVQGLKGINFGVGEMLLEDVLEVFDTDESNVRIIPHVGLNLPYTYKSNLEFMKHVLDAVKFPERVYMLCWRDDLNPNTPWIENSYDQMAVFFEKRGYGF
ncbi:MAG: hypothetical protein KGZ94_09925 [Clostridia bacterium]|nr:hypothetical protein [Clostridia bacterium]